MRFRKFLAGLVFSAVLACAAVISPGGVGQVLADTATPTTPPATVPANSSKITATYTYHGVPLITLVNPLHLAVVNGTDCGRPVLDISYAAISDEATWPWHDYSPCNQLGVTTQVCDLPSRCSDDFTYVGHDVRVSVPVGEIPAATLATAHFVHNAVPQTVTLTAWRFDAGGQVCSAGPGVAVAATVRDVAIPWPPARCATAGKDVGVVFTTAELGDLRASFQWIGGNADYDVDTGAFLRTPTPSPTATPGPTLSAIPQASVSPTPAQLPQSGGPPPSNPSTALPIVVGTAAIAATVAAWLVAARRRKTWDA